MDEPNIPVVQPETTPPDLSPSSKQKRLDSQTITAIAVTIISLCALFVSVYQARIMSQQQKLMVQHAKAELWPRLAVGISKGYDEKGINQFRIVLVNKGTGPAIIENVEVSFNGKVAKDWWQLFEIMETPDSLNTSITNSQISYSVFQSGDGTNWLELDDNRPLMRFFEKRIEEQPINIKICYKSVFEDRWYIETNFNSQSNNIEVKECNILEENRFES